METRLERFFMACGKGLIHALGAVFRLIKWLISKSGLLTLALIAVLGAGMYFDPTGFFATWKGQVNHFLSQFNFSMSGLFNACIVLAILYSKRLQKVALPFLDENLDAAKMWRAGKKFTTGDALLQFAFAIVNAGTINAILGLISNFGTPLG